VDPPSSSAALRMSALCSTRSMPFTASSMDSPTRARRGVRGGGAGARGGRAAAPPPSPRCPVARRERWAPGPRREQLGSASVGSSVSPGRARVQAMAVGGCAWTTTRASAHARYGEVHRPLRRGPALEDAPVERDPGERPRRQPRLAHARGSEEDGVVRQAHAHVPVRGGEQAARVELGAGVADLLEVRVGHHRSPEYSAHAVDRSCTMCPMDL
jgi:hypothetical protein